MWAEWMKEFDLTIGLEDLKKYKNRKKEKKMNELIKTILKEYSNIRIEKGDDTLEIADMKCMLQMLDISTLGDILADIKAHKKIVV